MTGLATGMANRSLLSSGAGNISGLAVFGNILGVAGAVQSSIGAYYSALSQRYELGARASDLEFQGSIADLNARAAEADAASILEAGRHEKGRITLRFGQVKATSRARQAAAGVQAGVGSAGEVQASIEAAKEIDALTIERNALRAAGAARTRAVDFRNRALFARTSAANLRRMRGTLIPGISALTSLIGGAGQVTSSYLYQQSFLQNR